jgi:hypothetical protein
MRREHTDRAQVRVPLDVLERALRKARIEYVRLAQLQGTDPGEEGESWAEFELNVEPHEGGPIRVFFPADDESRRVEHRGSTPRSSLPRSSTHAGAVHHTVMVTFDINVQGRRRVLREEGPDARGSGTERDSPGGSPSARARRSRPSRRDRLDHHPKGAPWGPEALPADTWITTSSCPHSRGPRRRWHASSQLRTSQSGRVLPRGAIREKKPERSSPGGARYERERQRTGRDDRLAADR